MSTLPEEYNEQNGLLRNEVQLSSPSKNIEEVQGILNHFMGCFVHA